MNKVKVTIRKRGRIPYIGNGPVIKPIYISQEIYDTLIKLGYPVQKVETVSAIQPTTKVEEVVAPKVEEVAPALESIPAEETVKEEEVVEEAPVEEAHEEPVVEETSASEDNEEVIVDDPNFSAEAFYTEAFLKTKAVCKSILDARKAEYADNASLAVLKNKVLESNPDVEFED